MNWEREQATWPNAHYSRFIKVRPHLWHIQEAGSGPCVLLLHGAGASTHTWRDVLPDLATEYRIIAIDLPGQGFTRLGDRSRCSLDAMSDDISALLVDLAIAPDAIVGHSAGAAIALRLAIDISRPPKAVVCINGALESFRGLAGLIFPAFAKVLSLNPLTAIAIERLGVSPTRVAALIRSTGSDLDTVAIDLYRRLMSDRRHVDGALAMMAQWNLERLASDLPKVSTSTLFLTGGRDRAVPPATSTRAARRIQSATIETWSDFGHLLHEEQPKITSSRIRKHLTQASLGGGRNIGSQTILTDRRSHRNL